MHTKTQHVVEARWHAEGSGEGTNDGVDWRGDRMERINFR